MTSASALMYRGVPVYLRASSRPRHDRGRGAVGHARAVHHPQLPGHGRGTLDGLLRYRPAELRAGVQGAVRVVLGGHVGHGGPELLRRDAVALPVRGHEQAEVGWRRGVHPGAVILDLRRDQAGVAGVLELFHADGHGDVHGAAGDGVDRRAQRLGAGRAHVLHPRDRLADQPQRPGQRHAADPGHVGAQPERVDVVTGQAGAVQRLGDGIDGELIRAAVKVLRESRAAHRDDGDTIAQAVLRHERLLALRFGAGRARRRAGGVVGYTGRAFQM